MSEITTTEPAKLPCGVVLPSDHQAARERIAAELEQQMSELRASAFIARAERLGREKVFATPCPVG